MQRHKYVFSRFCADDSGAIAILFGVSLMVLSMIIAVAIDTSRFYSLSSKLQGALDAAALASAKMLDEDEFTEAEIKERAKSYFDARIEKLRVEGATVANFAAVPNHTTGTVTVSVDTTITTIFGELGNIAPRIAFKPESTVVFKSKKIELAMVLDVTGSMCDVPPAVAADACSSGAKLSALKTASRNLLDGLVSVAPATNEIKVSIVPYSASVNVGADAAAWTSGASLDGCLVERTGGAAYSDDSPSSRFPVADGATFPAYSCPSAAILPLTDIANSTRRANLYNKIDALTGFGGTAGHIGLAWGWYTISPKWRSTWPTANAPRQYNPDKTIKAVVLMTDGMFNTSYKNGGEAVAWPNPQSSDPTIPGTSGFQALRICEELRDLGGKARVYTVGFQTPPEAEALLQECSGAENFYRAEDAGQLTDAFRDIARKLTSLRVSS